jgi:poly-gamma-glutamate capsule biosynthesis protein CapA/YwtB (metallophosphatase superfamily)
MKPIASNLNTHHPLGQVYLWIPDESVPAGGSVKKEIVLLEWLLPSCGEKLKLESPYAVIINSGLINLPDEQSESFKTVPLGNAVPDSAGNFIFEPFNGGGRMDKAPFVDDLRRFKNTQAARFGEVNTFFHVNKIAFYINNLLKILGERSLPRVKVVINAHPAIYNKEGDRDGVKGKISGKWLPFQGAHYRLSGYGLKDIPELSPVSSAGEIHLGPGWKLTDDGLLPESAGFRYRCNASHNAGIIYHEYGHHVTRHTADFMANRLLAPHRQINRKSDADEGISDYWAATMLNSPHIWAWHREHTKNDFHHRSLVSLKTMANFNKEENADPHLNGTILGAALWDIRKELSKHDAEGIEKTDMLVLKSLLLIGRLQDSDYRPSRNGTSKCRSGFSLVLTAMLEADRILYHGDHKEIIHYCFSNRGINSEISPPFPSSTGFCAISEHPGFFPEQRIQKSIQHIKGKDTNSIIPVTDELMNREELETRLTINQTGPFSLTAVGDIMLGERMNRPIRKFGPEYPFYCVYPIFRRSNIVLGNLEGPFSKNAEQQKRNFTYKVDPKNARILRRAGFNIVTLANNHLLDCGKEGVLETLSALKRHNIQYIGAGENEKEAHSPAIMQAEKYKIGLLGYYWNRRTAARSNKPGSAMDSEEYLANDIRLLRSLVDRVVVTVHWGVPYDRYPSEEDQKKAHLAIDCGADIIIGHHPHIVQPFEVYKNHPVFYSIGNFAFGSGNSKAEAILLGIDFQDDFTGITIFPAYIKNRDKRINYQPKILSGNSALKSIKHLKEISGASGNLISLKNDTGKIVIPR